jgi:nicotinamidase-related amidase
MKNDASAKELTGGTSRRGLLGGFLTASIAAPVLLTSQGAAFAQTPQARLSAVNAKATLSPDFPELKDVQIVFVDLQPDLVDSSITVDPKVITKAAGALAEIGKLLDIPMTCIVPRGAKEGELLAELKPFASAETTLNRVVTSPFMAPEIVDALAANQRKTLIVAGFATEVAVLQTSLDAIASGYKVFVPVDAIGSWSERTETAATRQIEAAGGTLTSLLALTLRLTPDLSRSPGKDVAGILFRS